MGELRPNLVGHCNGGGLCQSPMGGKGSVAASLEASCIFGWAERHLLAFFTMYNPLCWHLAGGLPPPPNFGQGEWSLHLVGFHQICLWCGTLNVNLLASLFNREVLRFLMRDPLVNTDALEVSESGSSPLSVPSPRASVPPAVKNESQRPSSHSGGSGLAPPPLVC